jgi:hypothetical protein
MQDQLSFIDILFYQAAKFGIMADIGKGCIKFGLVRITKMKKNEYLCCRQEIERKP